MNEFYCVACGNWKPLQAKVTRKGKRPICGNCKEKSTKRSKRK